MRLRLFIALALVVAMMTLWSVSLCGATDYNQRFIRSYPPGYYGMWYKAQRFAEPGNPGEPKEEVYAWDRFMSQVTRVFYPYQPTPFDWEYGNGRKFNLPDYNTNDWN